MEIWEEVSDYLVGFGGDSHSNLRFVNVFPLSYLFTLIDVYLENTHDEEIRAGDFLLSRIPVYLV